MFVLLPRWGIALTKTNTLTRSRTYRGNAFRARHCQAEHLALTLVALKSVDEATALYGQTLAAHRRPRPGYADT